MRGFYQPSDPGEDIKGKSCKKKAMLHPTGYRGDIDHRPLVCIIAGKRGPSASPDRSVGAKPENGGRSPFSGLVFDNNSHKNVEF